MVQIDQEQIRLLEQRLRGAGVDRRTFMKILSGALASAGATSLLAACGDDDDDDEATQPAATATTGAAQPTATTAAAQPTATTAAAGGSPTTVAAEPTATTAAVEPTATAGTLTDEQVLKDAGGNSDPASHDFNADVYCNGVAQIWSGPMTYDQDFQTAPDWVERWEPNDDASAWTFYFRQDNTGFTNGDPVNADTFIYSWKRFLHPDTKQPYASILYDIKNAQAINLGEADVETLGMTKIDDWTLEIEMEGPRGLFPTIAAFISSYPSHPPSVEAAKAAGDTYSTDPGDGEVITNGPFSIVSWDHDQKIELVRNDNHWRAAETKLERIEWPIIPAQQGFLPYEAGEVDWYIVPGAELPRVQSDAEMGPQVQKWVEPLIWKLLPAVNTEPFSDINVRRALSHCIDRDRINDLTNGGGDPAYCLMPPGLFAYFGDDEELRAIQAFDPEAAMAALVGTPYEGGENWPEVVCIMRDQEQHLNSQIMMEDIVAQVEDHIGLRITLQVMDFQAFRQELFENNYQLAWIRWYYDYPDPNNGYFEMFYSDKETGKRQAWSNAEFDQLTIEAKEAADPEKRLELYRQAELIMQTEVAYVPVVYRNAYQAFKPWVKGVPINRQGFWVRNGNIYVSMWNTVYIEGREG